MKKGIISSLLFLSFYCQAYAINNKLDSILLILDTVISNRDFYEKQLKYKRDSLISISEKTIKLDEKLKIWQEIAEYERTHNIRSALSDYNNVIHYAQLTKNLQVELNALEKKALLLTDYGLYHEGETILDSIEKNFNLNQDEYWKLMLTRYNLYDFFRVDVVLGDINNKKLSSLKNIEDSLLKHTSEYIHAITVGFNSYDVMATIKLLESTFDTIPERNKAICAAVISNKYSLIKDISNRDYWWGISAIYSIKNVQYEYEPLLRLSARLFELNDLERAIRYAIIAYKNANTYQSKIRLSESAHILYKSLETSTKISKKLVLSNKKLIILLIGITSIFLLCFISFILYYKKTKKQLNILNKNISEITIYNEEIQNNLIIQKEYISHFLQLSIDSILKIEQIRKNVITKLTTGDLTTLKRTFTESQYLTDFQQACLVKFDMAFLRLYPNFIISINKLFTPEERIKLPENELLNNELRILALQKLGITEGAKVATILGVSINTIYFYRNKLKNKAKKRETFEKDIQSI